MIVRKILQLLWLLRMLWWSLLKSKGVSMLLIIMLSGLLILQPPTMLSLRRGCLPRIKQETLVQWKWVILVAQKLWELVMCALKPMLVALWCWRMCDMFQIYGWMCFLYWLWIELVIVTTLVMEDRNLLRGHWLLQENMYVVVCTRLMLLG